MAGSKVDVHVSWRAASICWGLRELADGQWGNTVTESSKRKDNHFRDGRNVEVLSFDETSDDVCQAKPASYTLITAAYAAAPAAASAPFKPVKSAESFKLGAISLVSADNLL